MKTVRLTLPTPHEGQRVVLQNAARFNAVACGRRFGKTTMGVDLLLRPALCGKPVAWYSPSYPMLSEVWREVRNLTAPITQERNEQEKRIQLVTGGIIRFWSLTDPDSSRGHKYARVFIDEAAKVARLEEAWNAVIRPTLADFQGDAFLASTPRGRDFFHTCHSWGQDQLRTDWHSWQMPSWSNPHVPRSEFEEMRFTLPERIYQQEIEALFLEDGGGVFRGVSAVVDKGRTKNEPYDSARRYTMGVDIARVQDFTVIAVVDNQGRQVYHERFNQISWERQLEAIENAASTYHAAVYLDSTGVGDPIYEFLRKRGLKVEPFVFTNSSKESLIDNLAILIEQGRVSLMDLPVQTAELQAYEYELTPSRLVRMNAPAGMHDDCVIALALSVLKMDRSRPRFRPIGT
jgi:hypothetical protein